MTRRRKSIVIATALAVVLVAVGAGGGLLSPSADTAPRYVTNDAHLHLTNYIQEGTPIAEMVRIMGERVGRAAVFGIPLQQQWSYFIDGDDAPTYYLDTDAPLYYYSFTDAHIAMAYRSLPAAQQARFDPMITGFNPADMYAADHVRRVLETFPGVFVGIGEFSLHKEFVTSKVAGGPPSLEDPALDRLFSLAEEAGLVILVHCDVDTPFPREGEEPAYLTDLMELFKRHPGTTIIWAHIGVGRVVRPVKDQARIVEAILENPKLRHVHFDLSWSETAKYAVRTPETVRSVADVIARHPDRFLFGTDEVAPVSQADYLRVYETYRPLWEALPESVAELVRVGNYDRIFGEARLRVRAWERHHQEEQRHLRDSHARRP